MPGPLAALLAWVPFVHPLDLPTSARLWMFPPLAFCVALVYRATRARSPDGIWKPTLITFVNIVVGMWLIAVAVYGAHQIILRLS